MEVATNLHIDDGLVNEAVKIGKHKSKREAVDSALREYIQSKKRVGIFELFGTIEYEPGQDPMSRRKREREALKKKR